MRKLTSDCLLSRGFEEVGCWELNDARDLTHPIDLPQTAGVYAFAIDGIVQYVGLASKSVRKRLGFYRKPGASQRTNIRLNEIIRGHIEDGTTVQISIGHPPDFEWNGLKVSGAEGLEAGLISEFNLPWNMRGSVSPPQEQRAAMSFSSPTRRGDVAGQILELVERRPGMTELEIARKVYGQGAVQQQVNQHCRALLKKGLLERHGAGGISGPYTYRAKK